MSGYNFSATLALALGAMCALPTCAQGPWPDTGVASGQRPGARTRLPVKTALTGVPFTGTFLAPANIALKVQRQADMQLPATRLDSFVLQSGYNDAIYGDESIQGPPLYRDFEPIEKGINSPDLTTGHRGDAPPISAPLGARSPVAIEQERRLVQALIAQGLAYKDRGDAASAERLLAAALSIDPANLRADSALQAINPESLALLNARMERVQSAH